MTVLCVPLDRLRMDGWNVNGTDGRVTQPRRANPLQRFGVPNVGWAI